MAFSFEMSKELLPILMGGTLRYTIYDIIVKVIVKFRQSFISKMTGE